MEVFRAHVFRKQFMPVRRLHALFLTHLSMTSWYSFLMCFVALEPANLILSAVFFCYVRSLSPQFPSSSTFLSNSRINLFFPPPFFSFEILFVATEFDCSFMDCRHLVPNCFSRYHNFFGKVIIQASQIWLFKMFNVTSTYEDLGRPFLHWKEEVLAT